MGLSWWSGVDPEIRDETEKLMGELRAHDAATADRATRISEIVFQLAQAAEFDKARSTRIALAGYLHDVGKLSITPGMLTWPGELDDVQRDVMADHVIVDGVVPRNIRAYLGDDLAGITDHHETFLGDGYPTGIPDIDPKSPAQLVGLVSAYCSMTSNVPYRDAMSHDEAIEVLQSEVAYNWNPKSLQLFEDTLAGSAAKFAAASGKVAKVKKEKHKKVKEPKPEKEKRHRAAGAVASGGMLASVKEHALTGVAIISVIAIVFGAHMLMSGNDGDKVPTGNVKAAGLGDTANNSELPGLDGLDGTLPLVGAGSKKHKSHHSTTTEETTPPTLGHVGGGTHSTSPTTPTTKKRTTTTIGPPSPPSGFFAVTVGTGCTMWIHAAEINDPNYGTVAQGETWIRTGSSCYSISTRIHIVPWGAQPYYGSSGVKTLGSHRSVDAKGGGLGGTDALYSYVKMTNGSCKKFKTTYSRNSSHKISGYHTSLNGSTCPF